MSKALNGDDVTNLAMSLASNDKVVTNLAMSEALDLMALPI